MWGVSATESTAAGAASPNLLRLVDLRPESAASAADAVTRASVDPGSVQQHVDTILEQVRSGGTAAALDLSERFDGVRPESLRVPNDVIAAALAGLDVEVRDALADAIARVRLGHQDQVPVEVESQVVPGGRIATRWIPVRRVGLYVPGGQAVYPSSVIMNVVPAQLAGVESIAIVSPPQREHGGWPHPTILAAAALLGVDEVYTVGGAQAVAVLAYGTEDCAPVEMITGPGNVWVTAAKRAVRGRVGIDSEAGPTEIAILADDSADPQHVAADLISQAEHDELAASVLVTPDADLAAAVQRAVVAQVGKTKHVERVTAALTGPQSAIVLVRDLDQGLEVVDAYAAEHLEIQTRNAGEVARRVRNAGAIFVGPHTPVSLGDYAAGSNHVLPTGGCACHSSGLGVRTFLREVSVVEYDAAALRDVAATVVTLAEAEDLPGHADAIRVRTNGPAS